MAISDFLPAEKQKVAEERARHEELVKIHITRTFWNKRVEKGIAKAIATGKPFIVTLSASRQIKSLKDVWQALYEEITIPNTTGIRPDQVSRNDSFKAFEADLRGQGLKISKLETKDVFYGRGGWASNAIMNIEHV